MWRECLKVLWALSLIACGGGSATEDVISADSGKDTTVSSDSVSTDSASSDTVSPALCLPGASWTAGTKLFQEVTESVGLAGVEGEYLSVTDINADGWPDLIVRNGGGTDDFNPGGERSKWLLVNQKDGTFKDVTQSSGVFGSRINPDPQFGASARVVATGDVDNDGDIDVYIARSRMDATDMTAETSELMLNQSDGTFKLGPSDSDARFAARASSPAGVSFVDFDRDGFLDLWVVHNEAPGPTGVQDTLLKGDGKGGFKDVTYELGLTTMPWSIDALNKALAHTWGWGAVACDLNNDGITELMASSYGRMANNLWQGYPAESGVAYFNASISSGYAFDEDVDWRTNISAQCFCADEPMALECDTCPAPQDPAVCNSLKNAFGPNYRWNHDTGREPFSLGGVTGTTVCTDINNDGLLDLMNYEIVHGDVGSSADPSQVLINAGDPNVRFTRPGAEASGLYREETTPFWDHGDMTGAVFDFDNDGWQDIYVGSAEYAGTKGVLFRQSAPLTFDRLQDVDFFLHWRAHGVAIADFDRDGDLDIIVGHSRHRCEGFEGTECAPTKQVRLFDNVFGSGNNRVRIILQGKEGTNRMAIGARVEVKALGMTQTQQVDGGHGRFGLQRDRALHFGLSDACQAEVKVIWPDASMSTQSFSLDANRTYFIRQGEAPILQED